jgi:RNA polymerase sigma-70 factor, ECF subfamily
MMSEATWALLRRVFLADYSEIARQAQRLTGSSDLADDAMQDTYLRLEQGGEIGPVASPRGYLRQMVLNAARKVIRHNRVRSRMVDIVELLDLQIADETPDPERQMMSKADIVALRGILASLPERQRNIFISAIIDDVPLPLLAERHGIGIRMAQLELKKARDEIRARLHGANLVDFVKAPADASEIEVENGRKQP